MYFRLKSARPTYSANNFEKDFKQSLYYETLHRKNMDNPCMDFETMDQFKRSISSSYRNTEGRSKRPLTAMNAGISGGFYNSINTKPKDFSNAGWIKNNPSRYTENKAHFIPNSAKTGSLNFPLVKHK